jgi:hypothetical protein
MEHKSFRKHIHGRELEVIVQLPFRLTGGGYYEIAFLGKESERVVFQEKKLHDQVIEMWDPHYDPEGSEAEKVFNVAVKLLEHGKALDDVFKKIEWLVHQMVHEEKKIDDMIHHILK